MMAATVLVVEDEVTVADAVDILLRQEGFAVLRAATLSAARQALLQSPDLIILDIGLPDGSGLDLCREAQSRTRPGIIFLSSRSSEIDRVVGLELGADDYLPKPFSPRELLARVRAVLRRGQKSRGVTTPPPSSLVVDSLRKTVLVQGVQLMLPRLQFRILEVLAEQPGRVFSRSQLMDLAWDHPEEALDRAVDSQVRHLRIALKGAAAGEPIRTIRGEGYALEEHWPAP